MGLNYFSSTNFSTYYLLKEDMPACYEATLQLVLNTLKQTIL